MLWLNTDAAVDQARHLTGIGFYLTDDSHKIQIEQRQQIDFCDNHQAEWQAALWALTYLADHDLLTTNTIVLQTDSQLLVDSFDKRYSKHYGAQLAALLALTDQAPLFFVKKVGDHHNRAAHQLARAAIYQNDD
ncbi:reverse transcriptase-like protein [Lapidilactobacillus wuchangensis]|uniref:reverse transcriptase-like protein n=1 Tax=Lapidilactobacillus wuchangensis TaxID=2486001 RepID=UPI000F773EF4|nr:reverse transcriptase-like protein [Lapidilactobacillus wuchangensis]